MTDKHPQDNKCDQEGQRLVNINCLHSQLNKTITLMVID